MSGVSDAQSELNRVIGLETQTEDILQPMLDEDMMKLLEKEAGGSLTDVDDIIKGM